VSDIEKAARDAVEAAENTELTRQIAAILAAQQLLNQQPQQQAPVRQEFDAKKWVVIGGVVVAGGLVASLFAVAIAIGAVCATACLLILRGLWADFQKGR
jgi:ribose/xylose/arabinose/galactoside ABC-type transport system permease subunit